MTKYSKIIRVITLVFASICFLALSAGMIYYLIDVKRNNELKLFITADNLPFMITALAMLAVVISYLIFLIIKGKKK